MKTKIILAVVIAVCVYCLAALASSPFESNPTTFDAAKAAEFRRVFEMAVNNLPPRMVADSVLEALINASIPSGTQTVTVTTNLNNRAFDLTRDSLIRRLTFEVGYKAAQFGRLPADAMIYDTTIAANAATHEISVRRFRNKFMRQILDLQEGLPQR